MRGRRNEREKETDRVVNHGKKGEYRLFQRLGESEKGERETGARTKAEGRREEMERGNEKKR